MKLRCRLRLCKSLRCEIHITARLPHTEAPMDAAAIYKCNLCGKTKKATRSYKTSFVVPHKYLVDQALDSNQAKIVADAAIEKMKG